MTMTNLPYTFMINGEQVPAVAIVPIDPTSGEPLPQAGSADISALLPLLGISRLQATNGDLFSADAPATYDRDAGGNINYIEINDGGSVYRQTWTWTDGNLTATSGWVLQGA